MKRLTLLFIAFWALALPAQQTWKAVLSMGNLPVNLRHVAVAADSSTWIFYSPSQTSKSFPATAWQRQGDTLFLHFASLSAHLTLILDPADSTLSGRFRQHGSCDITFAPCSELWTFPRPQTPTQPYRFCEEQVSIPHKGADGKTITLSGTLTYPQGKGRFPAVVLVSGSGAQNRDEELFFHKPFLVIADYFAQRGIAVLRYDDRGTAHSTGDFATATTLDFASDAEAAFRFLRKHKRVDPSRVGIVGHSEGGLVAPIVASRNPKVAFIILMAGQGTSGAEVLLQQNERLFQLKGYSQALIDVRLDAMRQFFAIADTADPSRYRTLFLDAAARCTAGLAPGQADSIGLSRTEVIQWSFLMNQPWTRQFVRLDAAPYLAATRCPILALNGALDSQVLPVNLEAISRATSGRATTVLYPQLNHLFQHCETGATTEYLLIPETLAPEVLQQMADWILQQK